MASLFHERVLLLGSIGSAVLAMGAGSYLAHRTGDPHWMNRAGAAIVGTEGIIAVVEFHRRDRLKKIQATLMKQTIDRAPELDAHRVRDFLEAETRKAELHVLVIAVFLAMLGEVLHGFGDLLLEALMG